VEHAVAVEGEDVLGFRPSATSMSRQAMPAAPAPVVASFTSSIFLPATSSALSTAAPTMIAVPCWSSWNTGMFIRSRSLRSTMKHSGALMSSRLMPPKVGSSAAMMSTSLSGSRLVDLDVEHVDAGELLEQHALAFHHRLAGQRADVAQAQHRGAVGDHRHQVAARGVLAGLRGSAAIASQAIGHARRIRQRQVALGHHRLGRGDLDLARVIVQLDIVQTVAFAGLALFAGYALCRAIPVLRRYNLPEPVVGGLLVALAAWWAHAAKRRCSSSTPACNRR
jgi:hypothetical protein